tara:strand:+ start:6365 stop:8638 length:2274 start_codon:yes stop_codon:yes gene_type:complete
LLIESFENMRKILILLGIVLVLLILFLGVGVFSTSMHKKVFLWALDGKVENVSVETVRVGLNSIYIEDFNLIHEGTSFSTDLVEVEASWLDQARSRKIQLDELIIKGLNADLATIVTAGGGLGAWLNLLGANEEPSKEPWNGILAQMVPTDQVSIGRLRLDGQVKLSDQQTVDLNVSLDDLTVGEQARLVLQGAFLDEGETSLIERAVYKLSMELDQNQAGINSLAGQLELQALGHGLNSAGELNISGLWNVNRTSDGEILSLLIRDNDHPDPLFDTELDMNFEIGQLQGRLDARLNGSLLPITLLELPSLLSTATLATSGQVGWNMQTGAGNFALSGSGILDGRPLQYQFDGSGKAAEIPNLTGFLKTGFSDTLGAGEFTVNLDLNSENNIELLAPIEVKRGNRVSRLVLETNVRSLKLNPFEILVRGDNVYLEDLQSVGKALAGWGYSMQQLDTPTVGEKIAVNSLARSSVPWERLAGIAEVQIQRLVLPNGIAMEPFSIATSVRSDSVSLTSFSSRVESGTIAGKGDLIYSPNNPSPYTFRVEGSVANLPSGLVDLGSGAPITGSWTGSVSALGQAQQLEQISEAIEITMDLEGTSGLLKFSMVNEGANQSAQAVNLGVALLGGLLKNERFSAVSKMTQYVQCVPYDSIRLNVDRSSQGKVTIHNFSITGPELLLAGKGSVDATSWASLAGGALSMSLSIGSKGSFGENARILGLVGTDLNGEYELWRKPIKISGTLSNPNYSALRELIFDALR